MRRALAGAAAGAAGGAAAPGVNADIKMLEVIGRGGFGSVYKAFWRGMVVAVKVGEGRGSSGGGVGGREGRRVREERKGTRLEVRSGGSSAAKAAGAGWEAAGTQGWAGYPVGPCMRPCRVSSLRGRLLATHPPTTTHLQPPTYNHPPASTYLLFLLVTITPPLHLACTATPC